MNNNTVTLYIDTDDLLALPFGSGYAAYVNDGISRSGRRNRIKITFEKKKSPQVFFIYKDDNGEYIVGNESIKGTIAVRVGGNGPPKFVCKAIEALDE